MRAWIAVAGVLVWSAGALADLAVGQVAPPVRLQDQDGAWRDIAEDFGRHYVALTFYPKDDTRGCTLEAQSITAAYDELHAAGIAVYGVSVDPVDSKRAFCDKYQLKHRLLADVETTVSAAYGALMADRPMSKRRTVILDPARVVRVIDDAVKVQTHGTDLIAAVQALREADTAGSLAALADEPLDTGLGFSLRPPAGWRAEIKGQAINWTSADAPGVALGMIALPRQEAAPLTAASVQASVPAGVRLTAIDPVPVAGGPGLVIWSTRQLTDGPQAVVGARWQTAELDLTLSVASPPAQGAAAGHLLAAIVASIE